MNFRKLLDMVMWEPNLEGLEKELPDSGQARLAQFLIGVLVFAGYAHQSDARHVLSSRRRRLLTAAGLGAERAERGRPGSCAPSWLSCHVLPPASRAIVS